MKDQVACLLRQLRDKMADYYAPDYSMDALMATNPSIFLHDTSLAINSQNNSLIGWGDISGNNAHGTAGASKPTVSRSSRENGRTYATFASASQELTIPSQSLKEIFVVCKPLVQSGVVIAISNPGTSYLSSAGLDAQGGSIKRPTFAGPTIQYPPYGYLKDFSIDTPRIITFRIKDVGTLRSFGPPQQLISWGANGLEYLGEKPLNASNISFSPTSIGGYTGTSYDFTGNMYCVLGYTRTLNREERFLVMTYLSQRYGITLPPCKRLIGLGDSLMEGQGLDPTENLFGKLLGIYSTGFMDGNVWSGYNAGAGGNMTHDILAQGTHALDHCYKGAKNFMAVWAGTNNNGVTTTTVAINDIAEICKEARRRGIYSIIIPMLPTEIGSESFRTPLNAGYRQLVDTGVADFYYDGDLLAPEIYDVSAPSDTNLYQDGLHLAEPGMDIQAERFSVFLQSVDQTTE